MSISDHHDIVPAIEAQQVESGLRLWWFGGPSYAIKSPRSIVYVDPFYSDERADDPQGFIRVIDNYLVPGAVQRADLVLSTHSHLDHCDPGALRPIYSQTKAILAGSPSSSRMMLDWGFAPDRIREMTPGVTLTLGDVTLTTYPSRDWELPDAVTFVLQAAGKCVFIGGDTMYMDSLEEIGKAFSIDLAILALARNHYDVIDKKLYSDLREIARAALALGAHRVLPVHWDIWKGWLEDPHLVAPHLEGTSTEAIVLAQGESLVI